VLESQERSSSKFLRFAIIVSSFCLGIVLRLGDFGFFTTDLTGHFNFIDTDCYYQLRRLVYFLVHFPKTLTFDPLADWPTGAVVDWPDGFIYIVGLPLKIFGVHDFQALEIGACLMMILLGLVTAWCIYLLAKRILKDSSLALLVFFLACTNFLLVRFSCLGELDHHILEALFPILLLLLSLKAFDEEKKWAAIAVGLSISLFLWVSSSSVFMIGVFFLLYAFVFHKPSNQKQYFRMLAAFVASILPLAIYHRYSLGSWSLLTHPSFFHMGLVLLLAALSFAVSRYPRKALIIIVSFFAVGAGLYALNFPSFLTGPLRLAISYVFSGGGALQNVSEASPIFLNFGDLNLNFMHLNFGYFVYLLPLVWVFLFKIRSFSFHARILILSLSMLMIPAVFQKRFCHIMTGLFLIYLTWCLQHIHKFLKAREFRIGPMFTLLFICFSVFPGMRYGFYPEGSPRDRIDHSIAHFFIDDVGIKKGDAWNRLALLTPTDEAVFATPNLGHLLEYTTGLGVITNTFYHASGFDLDFKFRQAKSNEEFSEILKVNRIRYLVLVDDFKFLELQYNLRGLSTSSIVENRQVNGENSTIYQMQELMNFAWVRMLLAEGDIDHFKKLFRTSQSRAIL
jgi:hypothetical protein